MAAIRLGMNSPGLLPIYHLNCRPNIRSLWLLLAICFATAFVSISITARFGSLLQLLSTHDPNRFNTISNPNDNYGSYPIQVITSIKAHGTANQHLIVKPSKKGEISPTRRIPSYRTYGTFNRCINASGAAFQGTNNHKYFLGAVIANRIFEGDMFHMSTYDIRQWIEYMFYSGVEHIYWYDTAHEDDESQEAHLVKYVEMGLLTYHRFHKLFPDSIKRGYHFEQDNAYRHFLENYKAEAKWVAELDADEYPFSMQDKSSCFLRRLLLQEYERQEGSVLVSQVLMQCIFFLGNPIGNSENTWVVEKYQRRKNFTEGPYRQKPIFRPDLAWHILDSNPHFIFMRGGDTLVADEKRLRMNHYWGPRTTDFGPDTPELLAMLDIDPSVKTIVEDLKAVTGLNCTICTLQVN